MARITWKKVWHENSSDYGRQSVCDMSVCLWQDGHDTKAGTLEQET